MGTLDYMAPETFRGAAPDRRFDVYALGVLMYRMLTGTVPFPAARPELIPSLDRSDPPAPSAHPDARGATRAVDAVVRMALAEDPERRFSGMALLAAAIEASLHAGPDEPTTRVQLAREGPPPPRSADELRTATVLHRARARWPWLAAAVVGALVLGVLRFMVFSGSDDTHDTSKVSSAPPVSGSSEVGEVSSAPVGPEIRRPPASVPRAPTPDVQPGPEPVVSMPQAVEGAVRPDAEEKPAAKVTRKAIPEAPNVRALGRRLERLVSGCEPMRVQYNLLFADSGIATRCELIETKGYEQCITDAICTAGSLVERSRRGGAFRCEIVIEPKRPARASCKPIDGG